MERHTFYGCKALDGIDIPAVNHILIDGHAADGSVMIPDTVERIAGWAFYGNQKITGVTLGHMKEIEYSSFAYCKGLTEIELPDSLVKIGGKAFAFTGLRQLLSLKV